MKSIGKNQIFDFMKKHKEKRFTKKSLTEELAKEMGNEFSVRFRVVDKWLEVLLVSGLIKSEYVGKIKLFWYEGE